MKHRVQTLLLIACGQFMVGCAVQPSYGFIDFALQGENYFPFRTDLIYLGQSEEELLDHLRLPHQRFTLAIDDHVLIFSRYQCRIGMDSLEERLFIRYNKSGVTDWIITSGDGSIPSSWFALHTSQNP